MQSLYWRKHCSAWYQSSLSHGTTEREYAKAKGLPVKRMYRECARWKKENLD